MIMLLNEISAFNAYNHDANIIHNIYFGGFFMAFFSF